MQPATDEPLKKIELTDADFERYMPAWDDSLPLKEAAKKYMESGNEKFRLLHDQPYHAEHLMGIRCRMIDQLILFIYAKCEQDVSLAQRYGGIKATLIAQGGYGREEMNVHSDIDLLFLYPKKKGAYIEGLTEKILYVLWDAGLEVGYATRTLTECKKLFVDDMTIMTSLLEARFLCGGKDGYEVLVREIASILRSGTLQKKLIKKKLDEKKARIQKNGGSVFVLEPNIKEASGGIRDLHLPLWISRIQGWQGTYENILERGYLSALEFENLVSARRFLWRLRNELHLMVGRKVDLLTFQRQEALAPRMGFADSGGILAVEKFMQTYYGLAYQVATITDALIRRITFERPGLSRFFRRLKTTPLDDHFKIMDGHIAVNQEGIFEKDPFQMMTLFGHVQETGLPLLTETKDHLRAATRHVNEEYRTNPERIRIFKGMLNNYKNLGDTLLAMHDVHFLDEWIPEFKKLRCRVQHDAYHIYTIDTHSFFAVREISRLWSGDYHDKFPVFERVLSEIQHPEVLSMGVLTHDIGKGEGGNHSVKGARIANRITERLQFPEPERKGVEFLVLSHLIMPHLSQRRDLEDAGMIIQFARSMGSMDNLNMLFVLTWADIRAVGPEAWTDWKGELLTRLYEKARDVIGKGEFSREKTKEKIARIKEAMVTRIGNRFPREEYQHFLSLMPPRYFFTVEEADYERHFLIFKQAEREDIVSDFRLHPKRNMNEILIYTHNAPQVFSLVTGIMLAFSVNIIGAEVYQTGDGHILLSLMVTDPQGKPIVDETIFEKIREALSQVLFGQSKVDELIAKREVPDYLAKKPLQKAQTKIIVDNDVSAYYTVIDIYTHDRLGLLYDITRALNQMGCYVEISKISTKVEQVTDTFYVKDIFGHKIMVPEKIKAIKVSLQTVVGG